jgi:cytidyltransferase-like protein
MKKIGYCALTADYLHYGHIVYLEKCKENCKSLYVGIMSDECVIGYKGKKPIQTAYEREKVIRALNMVSGTFIQNSYEFPKFLVEMQKGKITIYSIQKNIHVKARQCVLIERIIYQVRL